jgi:hypothetical protein
MNNISFKEIYDIAKDYAATKKYKDYTYNLLAASQHIVRLYEALEKYSLKEMAIELTNKLNRSEQPEKNWEAILAEEIKAFIDLVNPKQQFLELINPDHNEPYVITIAKKFGNTPANLLKQSEGRLHKAANKIVNLVNENRRLTDKMIEQRNDLMAFNSLNLPKSLADVKECAKLELTTYDEINKAYSKLCKLATTYNKFNYYLADIKLNKPEKDLVKEFNNKCFYADQKNAALERQIKDLNAKLHKKKYFISKISKRVIKKNVL